MGRIGSLRVRCRSAWLLHFAAALRPFGPGNLTTEQCVQQRRASAEACKGSPCAGQLGAGAGRPCPGSSCWAGDLPLFIPYRDPISEGGPGVRVASGK